MKISLINNIFSLVFQMDSEEEKLERRFSSTRGPVRGRVKWGQTGEKSSTQSSRSSAKNGRPWSVSCDLLLTSTPPSYLYATLNPIPLLKKNLKSLFHAILFFFLFNKSLYGNCGTIVLQGKLIYMDKRFVLFTSFNYLQI